MEQPTYIFIESSGLSNYKNCFVLKFTKTILLYESESLSAKKTDSQLSSNIFTLTSKICFHELYKNMAFSILSHAMYLHYLLVKLHWHHTVFPIPKYMPNLNHSKVNGHLLSSANLRSTRNETTE